MGSLSKDIRDLGLETGADMIGFAPVSRFDNCPEKTHPRYYMDEAGSVIVIAIGYPRSIGEVWGTYKDEGLLPTPYMWFGFSYLNWELSRVALKLTKYLDCKGYKSIPLPPSYTISRYRYWEDLDKTGKYLGDLSIKHAAVAAGMGAFGWNNLLLTEKFGARQRIIAIITEASFEVEEMIDSSELCKPELCDHACVSVCPITALSKNKAQEFIIGDKTYKYGELDHGLCRWCLDGFTEGSGSRTHFDPPEKIKQSDLAAADSNRKTSDKALYAVAHIDFCGKCMHQCPSPDFKYNI
jgi:epoxyqueuosine reductase QueG